MLYIYFELPTKESYEYVQNNYITRVSAYFDNEYEDSWFEDNFTKEVIKEIDKSEVVGTRCIYNEFGGSLPVTDIATGSKSLLLLNFTDKRVSGDRMGDNCTTKLLEIASRKDIYISLDHLMKFSGEFTAIVENTNVEVHNMEELLNEYIRSV